jgi:hypothetical protein
MRFEIVNPIFATFCDEMAPLQVREKNRKPENPLNKRKKAEDPLKPAELVSFSNHYFGLESTCDTQRVVPSNRNLKFDCDVEFEGAGLSVSVNRNRQSGQLLRFRNTGAR